MLAMDGALFGFKKGGEKMGILDKLFGKGEEKSKKQKRCAKCGKRLSYPVSTAPRHFSFDSGKQLLKAMDKGLSRAVYCERCTSFYCKECTLRAGEKRPGEWHLICPQCGKDLGDIGLPV